MNEARVYNHKHNYSYYFIYIVVIPYVPSSSLLQYLRSNKSLGCIPLHIYDEIKLIRKLLVIVTCLMCELVRTKVANRCTIAGK